MAEIIKETVTTQADGSTPTTTTQASQTQVSAAPSQTIEYIIYFFLGALEVLLAFRLILKLTGANPVSGFVSFIYTLSKIFIMPFEGIFRRAVTEGIETAAVLEPATIVAMIVYAVVIWGLVKLFRILTGQPQV